MDSNLPFHPFSKQAIGEKQRALDTAFSKFVLFHSISECAANELRAKLYNVPRNVLNDELRTFRTPNGLITPQRQESNPNTPLKKYLSPILKGLATWQRMNRQEKQALKHSLHTRGTTILRLRGKPSSFPYEKLEEQYIEAIEKSIENSKRRISYGKKLDNYNLQNEDIKPRKIRDFPLSRARTGEYGGPALELLLAALSHALPVTGAPTATSSASRIIKREKDNRKKEKSEKL